MPVQVAEVVLWGRVIGAVSWDAARGLAAWEYSPAFQRSGIQLAPLTMPLGPRVYTFPALAPESFYGLPGMLADSLPDKFGNTLIDQWLARSGRDRQSFSPIERLCYIGSRGMGALEFKPALRAGNDRSADVDIAQLVHLANEALSQKLELSTQLDGSHPGDIDALRDILRVGTSAGGARAKAIIAWNESTQQVRSGQVAAPEGFTYWLLKFDGVAGNRDKELSDPKGYGKVEYAYYLMARAAGIEMSECRLLNENGRHHFMTQRFDRTDTGHKLFMQSLCAVAHMDFNQAGAYSYEQALDVARSLGLKHAELQQLFLRCAFNIMARNQDDHTKNIAFLMDQQGHWSLAPAFDVTYSYNPNGAWTNQHQMTLGGRRDGFQRGDFYTAAKHFRLGTAKKIESMLEKIDAALVRWPEFAESAEIPSEWIESIASHHRRLATLT